MEERKTQKTVQQLALLELNKNARILQRQLKIMRGIRLSSAEHKQTEEIISSLEKEFQIYRM